MVEGSTGPLKARSRLLDGLARRDLSVMNESFERARIDQTLVYLRRKNKQKAMEVVRTLSWGGGGQFVFPPSEAAARKKPPLSRGFEEIAHTGFEPVLPP